MRTGLFLGVLVGLLAVAGCGGGPREGEGARGTEVGQAPGTAKVAATATAETVASATPTAGPATAVAEATGVVREGPERLGQAGLVYDRPAGYEVEYGWHKVWLRPPGADAALGPLIEIDSNPFLCGERVPVDGAEALEEAVLCASWRLDAVNGWDGEPARVTVGGQPALTAEVEGWRDGVAMRMRVYALKPGPTRVVAIMGLSAAEGYVEMTEALEAIVASMRVLTWQSFTNGNDVADVAFFDGYLWTATSGGVVAWPLGGGILPVKYTVHDGLPANAATALTVCPVMGEATLFAGTSGGGVARFDPGRWTWVGLESSHAEWADDRVRALGCALENRLVVGYEEAGVDIVNLDEGVWTHFSRADGVPEGLRDVTTGPGGGDVWLIGEDEVALISAEGLTRDVGAGGGGIYYQGGVDGAGALWLAAYYRVGRRTAAGEWTYLDNRQIEGLFDTSATALAVAADDTIWIGSYNQVARFDPTRGQVVDGHRGEPGMVAGFARTLRVDPMEGWLAYGVEGTGASVLRDGWWLRFVLEDEPLQHNGIRTLAQDRDGKIWYGDRWGRVVYADPGDIGSPGGIFEVPRGFPLSMYPDPEGGVWVGHFDGASLYTPDGARHLTAEVLALRDQYIRAVTRDAGGRLWLGGDEGLFIWDGEGVVAMTDLGGLTGVEVRALQPDGEAMWVGTRTGLARVEGARVEVFDRRNSALPDDVIGALALDPWGDLLVAAGSTLLEWEEGRGEFGMLLESTGESPLTAIAVADDGEMWVTTGRDGVYSLVLQGQAAEWQHLRARDGVPSNDYAAHAVLIDGDGVVWLGGATGGLGRYGP